MEIAIAPSDPNYIYASIANSSGCLKAVWQSKDNGENWIKIINAQSNNSNDPFNESNTGCQGAGWYSHSIAVNPIDKEKVYVGGIKLFMWNGADSSFQQIDATNLEGANESNPKYLAKYKHNIVFDHKDSTGNTAYITTDQGVFRSYTMNHTASEISFEKINMGLNSSMIFGLDAGIGGEILTGTAENGNILMCNNNDAAYPLNQISGSNLEGEYGSNGAISSLKPEVIFYSLPFGRVRRSFDKGTNIQSFIDETIGFSCDYPVCFSAPANCNAMGDANFVTRFHLMETRQRSVKFPTAYFYNSSDTIFEGLNTAISSTYTTFEAYNESVILPGDTHFIEDPLDSKFFLQTNCGFWVCSNPLSEETPVYHKVSNAICVAFDHSADGNHLYCLTTNSVIIFSGFNELNLGNTGTRNQLVNEPNTPLTTKIISIGDSVSLEGISVDKNNPNHVLISSVRSSGRVFKITDALEPNTVVTNILKDGDLVPFLPVYNCLIDIEDSNIYYLATELGIFATSNQGESWSAENRGLGMRIPVYDLKQKYLHNEECPVLYAGTHGAGVIRSLSRTSSLCNTIPQCAEAIIGNVREIKNAVIANKISVFPNPTQSDVTIEYDSEIKTISQIRVFDMLGKIVIENTSDSNEGLNQIKLNTHFLSGGYYFVHIENPKTKYQPQIFIKK
jgi:hypothetical protein